MTTNIPPVKSGPLPPAQAWQPPQPQVQAQAPAVDPNRERQDRQEERTEVRRRRKGGSLNRMAQYKLDFIDPEYLDLETYVYRWVNDESSKLRMATRHDDYDYVNIEELKGFDPEGFDSEGGGHVRVLVGESRHGGALYAYLLKKRRSFWDADNDEVVRAREDMMAGRVYNGEIGDQFGDRDEMRDGNFDGDNYYSTKDSQIGGSAARKRGPIPKRVLR